MATVNSLLKETLVSEPEIQKYGFRSYATYKLTSKIAASSSTGESDDTQENKEVTVRRRYREFVLLQDTLRAKNAGLILPPLPPATIHMYPSRELIERRITLLQRYLDNLLNHTILSRDPVLLLFTQATDFKKSVKELHIVDPLKQISARVSILPDTPQFPDALEGHLEYLVKITNRLEILKIGLLEFFAAKQNLADRITGAGKSITSYLDATTDSGNHARLVQLIDSLDTISELVAYDTDQILDARSFVTVVDDYLRMMKEVEQTFATKRALRASVYALEVQLIDLQATLTKSQNEANRDFDKNYCLSIKYLERKDEHKQASQLYDAVCRMLSAEMDRIDCRRVLELEACIDHLLRDLLEGQVQVMEIWEIFLDTNRSIGSLGDETKSSFAP